MRAPLVEFDLAGSGRVLIARVAGEIDAANAGELRLAISDRIPATAAGLVLDLAGVAYLDSSGVHLLFDLSQRLRARRQLLRLVVPDDSPVRRVLALCDVDRVAPMASSLDGALQGFEGSREAG